MNIFGVLTKNLRLTLLSPTQTVLDKLISTKAETTGLNIKTSLLNKEVTKVLVNATDEACKLKGDCPLDVLLESYVEKNKLEERLKEANCTQCTPFLSILEKLKGLDNE